MVKDLRLLESGEKKGRPDPGRPTHLVDWRSQEEKASDRELVGNWWRCEEHGLALGAFLVGDAWYCCIDECTGRALQVHAIVNDREQVASRAAQSAWSRQVKGSLKKPAAARAEPEVDEVDQFDGNESTLVHPEPARPELTPALQAPATAPHAQVEGNDPPRRRRRRTPPPVAEPEIEGSNAVQLEPIVVRLAVSTRPQRCEACRCRVLPATPYVLVTDDGAWTARVCATCAAAAADGAIADEGRRALAVEVEGRARRRSA